MKASRWVAACVTLGIISVPLYYVFFRIQWSGFISKHEFLQFFALHPAITVLAFSPFVAITGLLLYWVGNECFVWYRLSDGGQAAKATVISVIPFRSDQSDFPPPRSTRRHVLYTFSVPGAAAHFQGKDRLMSYQLPDLTKGAEIWIRFDVQNPGLSRIDDGEIVNWGFRFF